MIDAAKSAEWFLKLFVKEVLSPSEFATAVIDNMLRDEACNPVALFGSLPDDARAAILDQIRQYAEKDYLVKFFYIGPGESAQAAIDRQPKLRELCHALLSR